MTLCYFQGQEPTILRNSDLAPEDSVISSPCCAKRKELLDFFVVNTFVFSENHENLNSKISILRVPSEKHVDSALGELHKALWLGQLPKPGRYFSEPISRWLRYKLWRAGRRSKGIYRYELGVARFSTVAEIEAHGRKLKLELPERSESQYFAFKGPNYDYFDLPANVDSHESLMDWLGLPGAANLPSFRSKRGVDPQFAIRNSKFLTAHISLRSCSSPITHNSSLS